MADITFPTVLKLIYVIKRAGIDTVWPDFLRAYHLPETLEPRRSSTGYGYEHIEEMRMEQLKELHREIGSPWAKKVFEKLIESVLDELDDLGNDYLRRRSQFWDYDPAAAQDDLETLTNELQEAGYRIESGRLVAEDTRPVEAEIDAVTGLGNRVYLERESARVWAQCRSDRLPVAIIFLDIDNFGTFNKLYGHEMGDRVLRAVSTVVHNATRLKGGTVGRYGGEEIVATMRNLIEAEAKALGERIRDEVEHLMVDGLNVSVSIGVASSADRSLKELQDAADRAVREAKAQGKNRAVAFSELPPVE